MTWERAKGGPKPDPKTAYSPAVGVTVAREVQRCAASFYRLNAGTAVLLPGAAPVALPCRSPPAPSWPRLTACPPLGPDLSPHRNFPSPPRPARLSLLPRPDTPPAPMPPRLTVGPPPRRLPGYKLRREPKLSVSCAPRSPDRRRSVGAGSRRHGFLSSGAGADDDPSAVSRLVPTPRTTGDWRIPQSRRVLPMGPVPFSCAQPLPSTHRDASTK